jgi:predicted MPP superfamily phosphohydrolase
MSITIALISDIHLDHYIDDEKNIIAAKHTFVVRGDNPDAPRVLVVAGDISTFDHRRSLTLDFFCNVSKLWDAVVVVLGNHDYYNSQNLPASGVRAWWSQTTPSLPENVHLLQCQSIRLYGTLFVGATMWTGLETSYRRRVAERHRGMLLDFRKIAAWTPNSMHNAHHREAVWLHQNLEPGCVVVSHHPPFEECLGQAHRDPALDVFFSADLDAYKWQAASLWLHGHVHDNVDFTTKYDTRVVCFPHGYPGECSVVEDDAILISRRIILS